MSSRFFSLSLLNNQFPALHGLRFLAILGIIQLHATAAILFVTLHAAEGIAPTDYGKILSLNSWFAMDLFFIMSGFLIGKILFFSFSDYGQENRSSPRKGFVRFYLRRAFRTFPLYYVFLFAYLYLGRVLPIWTPTTERGFTSLLFNELAYMTNYPFQPEKYLAPWSWSLSVEEHFYLISPILILFLMRIKTHQRRLLLLSGLWLMGPVTRFAIYWFKFRAHTVEAVMSELYTPTHARFDILIAGLILAYFDQFFLIETKAFFANRLVKWITWLLPAMIFALMLSPSINPTPLGVVNPSHLEFIRYTAFTGVFYYGFLTSIAYLCLIPRLIYFDSRMSRWLAGRTFLYFATLGYAIYLVHMPICYRAASLANQILPSANNYFFLHWIFATIVTLAASTALAYVMHILIEKPFLMLRDHWAP